MSGFELNSGAGSSLRGDVRRLWWTVGLEAVALAVLVVADRRAVAVIGVVCVLMTITALAAFVTGRTVRMLDQNARDTRH